MIQQFAGLCLLLPASLRPVQESLGDNEGGNRFRLIICKNQRGQALPQVKFSMDLGAIYKLGANRRLTKRQQKSGIIESRLARGSGIKRPSFGAPKAPDWDRKVWLVLLASDVLQSKMLRSDSDNSKKCLSQVFSIGISFFLFAASVVTILWFDMPTYWKVRQYSNGGIHRFELRMAWCLVALELQTSN